MGGKWRREGESEWDAVGVWNDDKCAPASASTHYALCRLLHGEESSEFDSLILQCATAIEIIGTHDIKACPPALSVCPWAL